MKRQYKTPPTHFLIVAHFFLGGLVLATIIGTIVSVIVAAVLASIVSNIAGATSANDTFLSDQTNTYAYFAVMVLMAPIGARMSARYLKNKYRVLAPDKIAVWSTWLLVAYLILPWLLPGHAPLTIGTITNTGSDADSILHLVATVTMVVSQFAIAYTFYLASKKFLALRATR